MDFDKVLGWKAEGMRFSLFTTSPNTAQSEWWSDFVGSPHETSTAKASTGEFIYTGNYESGILELRLLPDRIDWIFRPNVEASPFFPSVGEFATQLKIFRTCFEEWMKKNPGVYSRIAFSVTLLDQVNGREEGYSVINTFLPFLPLQSADWKDFYFQFNKRALVPNDAELDISVNRLVNYSIAHVQTMTFNGTMLPTSHYFARIEIDINTQFENNYKFEVENVLALLGGMTDITKILKDLSEV